MAKFPRVSYLWKNESKTKGTYLNGKCKDGFTIKPGQSIYVYRNENKDRPTSPDYVMVVKEEE